MDNYRFDITAELSEAKEIIALIGLRKWQRVAGYAIRPAGEFIDFGEEPRKVPTRLLLYWTKPDPRFPHEGFVEFPEPLGCEEAAKFAVDWLDMTKSEEKEPDIDGTVKKGFRLYNEQWGHVENRWEICAAITHKWATFGK